MPSLRVQEGTSQQPLSNVVNGRSSIDAATVRSHVVVYGKVEAGKMSSVVVSYSSVARTSVKSSVTAQQGKENVSAPLIATTFNHDCVLDSCSESSRVGVTAREISHLA